MSSSYRETEKAVRLEWSREGLKAHFDDDTLVFTGEGSVRELYWLHQDVFYERENMVRPDCRLRKSSGMWGATNLVVDATPASERTPLRVEANLHSGSIEYEDGHTVVYLPPSPIELTLEEARAIAVDMLNGRETRPEWIAHYVLGLKCETEVSDE